MRALALLLALLPSLAFGAAPSIARDPDLRTVRQAKLRPLRWASPVAARYRFESTGGDWALPPEAPVPTIDCRLSEWSSGTLDCGGATFTPSGSPTAGVASYWRPGGGAAGTSVGFDGVDDFFGAAASAEAGDRTICTRFVTDTIGDTIGGIVGAYAVGDRSWSVYRYRGKVYLYVCKGDTNAECTLSSSLSVVSAGVSTAACFSYDYVADGSSVLRSNVSGVEASVTTAVGPLASSAEPMRIGSYAGADYWDGTISRVTIWSGWAASASDLARLVRSQYAAQGSLGEPVTWTRASTKSCQIGSAWFTVPANQPCIGDAGALIDGADTNYLTGACSGQADQTTGSLAAGSYTLWMEGAGSVAAAAGTAVATGLPCTATAASACSFTVTTAGTVAIDVTGTVTAMQLEGGARSSLICSAATPAARAADVPTAGHGIADPNRWCVSFKGIPSGGWQSGIARYLFSIGTGANRVEAFTNVANNLYFSVYDATNTGKTVYRQAPTGTPEIDFCASGGALSISYNNVVQAVNATGAGTGVIGTLAASASVGSTAVGTSQFDGSISAVTTCNTPFAGECQ